MKQKGKVSFTGPIIISNIGSSIKIAALVIGILALLLISSLLIEDAQTGDDDRSVFESAEFGIFLTVLIFAPLVQINLFLGSFISISGIAIINHKLKYIRNNKTQKICWIFFGTSLFLMLLGLSLLISAIPAYTVVENDQFALSLLVAGAIVSGYGFISLYMFKGLVYHNMRERKTTKFFYMIPALSTAFPVVLLGFILTYDHNWARLYFVFFTLCLALSGVLILDIPSLVTSRYIQKNFKKEKERSEKEI